MVGRSKLSDEGVCKDKINCTEAIKGRDEVTDNSPSEPFNFRKIDPKTLTIPKNRNTE